MKTCTKCGDIKPKESFPSNGKGRPRLNYCHPCRNEQRKKSNNHSLESFLKYRVSGIRRRQKSRSVPQEFNLTWRYVKDLYQIQKGRCCYTGKKLVIGPKDKVFSGPDSYNILSVDRVDNNKGYIKGNVVLSCSRANSIKSNQSIKEFKSWMPTWYQKAMSLLGKMQHY